MLHNKHGDELISTFPENLKETAASAPIGIMYVTITVGSKRFKKTCKLVRKVKDGRSIVLLTDEQKLMTSNRVLNEQIFVLFSIFDLINELLTEQANIINLNTKLLIHNLVKINSYNIQNIFSVIPQQSLTQNISSQREVVKSIIKKDVDDAVPDVILETVKNNLAMQVEFSVFDKLLEPHPSVDIEDYDIRSVVLSVLHVFYSDFISRNISVSLGSCERVLSIDYQVITVSLFYLFDNAVKYCLPSTTLKITFDETERGIFKILFDMISVEIRDHELSNITSLSYRGGSAKKIDETGSGIGLFRVVKTLNLNNAHLNIQHNVDKYNSIHKNVKYRHNIFTVVLKNQSYKY